MKISYNPQFALFVINAAQFSGQDTAPYNPIQPQIIQPGFIQNNAQGEIQAVPPGKVTQDSRHHPTKQNMSQTLNS